MKPPANWSVEMEARAMDFQKIEWAWRSAGCPKVPMTAIIGGVKYLIRGPFQAAVTN